MKLILIRHGATAANETGKYMGRTNELLSAAGIHMIQEYQKQGRYPDAVHLVSSPMGRCVQTAGLIYPKQTPLLEPAFQEIDFGRFEGKDYRQLQADPYYQKWIDSCGMLPFPEGESRAAFIRRVQRGFARLCRQLRRYPAAESAAVIAHGGTLMAILSTYTNRDYYEFQCNNGGGYCCELEFDSKLTAMKRGADHIQIHEIQKL